MSRTARVFVVCSFVLTPLFAQAAVERILLWRVVQTCIANHNLTGASFPCLAVDTAGGADAGFAVLRAPLEETHIIVTPTVRTVGIEANRLRGSNAPDYFRDAWAARHFVTDGLPQMPRRDDLGLAVNSREGRSQDQLHIHVDCLRQDVKASLERQAARLHPHTWTHISVVPQGPPYWATTLESADLAHLNPFDLAASGLKVEPERMRDMTIVVAGADSIHGGPGFILLARLRRPDSGDAANGEVLLDHACASFR